MLTRLRGYGALVSSLHPSGEREVNSRVASFARTTLGSNGTASVRPSQADAGACVSMETIPDAGCAEERCRTEKPPVGSSAASER